jgi:hypothetical protein
MNTGRPFIKKGRLRVFLKDPLLKELGITPLDQKPAQGTHLQGH